VVKCDEQSSVKDLKDEDAFVEVEEDTSVKKDAVRSPKESAKPLGPPKDKAEIIKKVLETDERFNQMQKIPSGIFTMGTDEMITRDGETPSRK